MKLLFDQNLSHALVLRLSALFPGSAHIKESGRMRADDSAIWDFAMQGGFTIVSKDADFQQRSLLLGAPPKVVWLRVGNCPTARIESLLREHSITLHNFEADAEQSLLVLS
jgi:predicted nuclease of predicted toxin-antitoxin system